MSKKDDIQMLIDTILFYKTKTQTRDMKKQIQKLQQKLDKLNDKKQ